MMLLPANFDTSNFGYDRAVSVPASYVPDFSSSEETCESGQSGFCTQVSVVTAETVRAHPPQDGRLTIDSLVRKRRARSPTAAGSSAASAR
ncbi:hypothetical protein [Streptomyces mirabilis]|uniref:hypothetical protein n=1 Tax=Streptomyces mirabilis TaxID=68239 RepID=UPI002254C78E|nr:hypothetical protein [Streptomyces mirabilis]MCX4426090.1 hypothetical protein [Streptomyces mirabilis]